MSNWQQASIGLDNDLTPNRWQFIILTGDGLGFWHLFVSLGLDEVSQGGLDKMEAILWIKYSEAIFWNFFFQISLKFVPKGPINN